MVDISKVGEPDAVLDVHRVVVRPRDERPGEAEGEPVVLHRAPGLDLADGEVVQCQARTVSEDTPSRHWAVT